MSINITKRLTDARAKKQAEYENEAAGKLGVLRAGNSGMMSETGDVAGKCPRISHLRSLGYQDVPDEQKRMMFELGFASEDITADLLNLTLEEGEVLLREEEIPIEWVTRNGTKVTGRPDIVLCKQAKELPKFVEGMNVVQQIGATPILALELKSVHSMWTARNVVFGAKDKDTGQTYAPAPTVDNLVQAGHYMWKLGIPYKIIYKAYSQLGQSAGSWAVQVINIPKPGEKNSQYIDYDNYGKYKGMLQFEIVYDLRIDKNNRIQFKLEEDKVWTNSIVTTTDIERYFNFTAEMATTKNLGPRPMAIHFDGEKLSYSPCSYCPLKATCDKTEDAGYDQWLAAAKKELASGK